MSRANDVDADELLACTELSKSHQRLRTETRERLTRLLAATPLLRDLNCDVTPEEIAAEIATVHGESIKVYVIREPYQQLKIIVPRNGTVRDLKAAIRRSFTALQHHREQTKNHSSTDPLVQSSSQSNERRLRHTDEPIAANISWKYIWRTYYLQSDSGPITDDTKTLLHYDICNKSILKFVKKIKIDRRLEKKLWKPNK